MRPSRLPGPISLAALLLAAGCGAGSPGASGSGSGYEHTEELLPHPGIAEGRPVVSLPNRGTHYLCPPLKVGEVTPLLTDRCLTPGYAATSTYGDYSMLEPSVACADGRFVTDAGTLGLGFVGEPLLPERGTPPGQGVPSDLAAVRECLRVVGRG